MAIDIRVPGAIWSRTARVNFADSQAKTIKNNETNAVTTVPIACRVRSSK